jgi:hypothetical protein
MRRSRHDASNHTKKGALHSGSCAIGGGWLYMWRTAAAAGVGGGWREGMVASMWRLSGSEHGRAKAHKVGWVALQWSGTPSHPRSRLCLDTTCMSPLSSHVPWMVAGRCSRYFFDIVLCTYDHTYRWYDRDGGVLAKSENIEIPQWSFFHRHSKILANRGR